jgi:tubulin-specific chaperone A
MASAKQIRDEIMKMTIIVNSNPAQQEIYKLAEANRKLADESTKLRAEREKVRQTLGKESQEYKELTQKINDNSLTISNNKRKMQELTDSLDINQMSVKQLRQELTLLKRELDRTVPGSNQYNALQERIGQVSTRLGEVRNGARSTQMSFQHLADRFNHYSGIVTAVAAVLIGFGLSVQNVIDRNNKMADAMSQVEKNANMTRQEVEALTRSFSDMDTRTKKIDLLKIATAGGRLGVAKEDIKDFVVEVDKANVALGDSWEGGADKIAEEIGRIALSYEETKNQPIAKSISEIGSALNELAADGASSESNIADFMNRLGSLPPSMKPPINTLLGLGAALEESSIKAEIGSSGISKFFRVAGTNVEAFADVMQRPVQEVKDLINSNPAEFFLQFSEGLKAYNTTDVTQILDKLKLNDNEVQRVIGAATEKSERFREVIEKSNQAFKERNSLQKEFDKVNNNSAAIYEKIQRKISELFTSQTFANYLNTLINLLGKFLGVVKDTDGYVTAWRNSLMFLVKVMAILMVSTISYNLLLGTYNTLLTTAKERVLGLTIIEKARNGVTALGNISQAAWNTVVGIGMWLTAQFTRNLTLQTAAQERLNLVTKANPWGALLAVVLAVGTAYLLFRDNTKKAIDIQEELNNVIKEGAKNAGAEVNALEQTYKKLTNKNIAEKDRQKLLDEANKQYPGYFKNLTTEDFLLGKAAGQYNKLRTAIIAASQARAADAKINEIAGEYLEKEVEINGKIAELKTKLKNNNYTNETRTYVGQSGGGTYTVTANELKGGDEAQLKRLRIERDQLLREKTARMNPLISISNNNPFKGNEIKNTDNPNSKFRIPGDPVDKVNESTNKAESEHKKLMEDYKQRADEAGKLSVELEKEINEKKIEAMEDGFAKELALIDEQERQKLAELENKKITPEEIAKLQEITAKATGTDKEFFDSLLKQWKANNAKLETAKAVEVNYFNDRRKALGIKYKNEELAEANKAYEDKLALLERQKNDEINSFNTLEDLKKSLVGRASASEISQINTWQKGKEALTKVYQKKELELHIAHLESMVKLYEGLDLTILDEKEREKVMKFITEAQNKIASLKAGAKGAGEVENTPKKLSSKGSTDVLGMSFEDWDIFFTNLDTGVDKLGTMMMAVKALQEAFNTYYQLVQAKEQAQVRQVEVYAKRREKSLKNQLDRGIISQEEYEAGIQSLNEETEKKKAQLEYEAAKRQRVIQIGQIIANTAQAIMSIWAQVPKFDFGATAGILTGVVSALGALQVATVLSTPLPEAPGYEQGFGMEYDMMREQDGKKFRTVRRRLTSGLVDRPTHFIAGENGVEMVIDNPTYTKFPESVKRTLNRQIAIAKGYEGGRYPYLSNGNDSSSPKDDLMIELLMENREAIRELRKTRFTAVVDKNDMRSAKNIIEMQDDYNYLKNK